VAIQSISADIEENGVRLRLTVVDTPGFGDFVNNDQSWNEIVNNIEQRFDAYLEAENKVNRTNIVDNRIHACVYFIQPTGHSLKPLDVAVMTRLHTKVNLIPVIAKADTLTDDEVLAFKRRVSAKCPSTDNANKSRFLPILVITKSRFSKVLVMN
jgi:septin 7